MDLSISSIPIWLSALFTIIFFIIPPLMIANTAKTAIKLSGGLNSKEIKKNILVFYWFFFIVVAIISLLGVFSVNTFPPRIIIITTLPLFLFYLLYVSKKKWFQIVFKHVKTEQLVFIHIFRLVGVFFFIINYYGSLPDFFAQVGGIGDILTAVLAVPVIYAIKRKLSFAKTLAWIWNIISFIDITLVISIAIYLTKIALKNNENGILELGVFPFSWIPAFAPATIIFLHILIFKKLLEKQKTQE
ncbi:hypothetical protein ACSIGC_13630 [Tenacibaculum sp. ZS6-P6]|uniref:hypothetical protein n=1 Tax=Tenacibaculum sp. ZS6-P6 TaxID=3447503 RepID=UPI003F99D213